MEVAQGERRWAVTDHELMARLARGDTDALTELMRRHRDWAVAEAKRYLRDDALAEDMAQEAFARVYLARADYRECASFRTWLGTILRRLCVDQLRRARLAPVPSEKLPEWPAPSAEAEYLALERRTRLWNELAALPPTDAALLVEYALDGLSYRELAERHGLTVPQVKIRLHRLRRRLRAKERDDGWR